MDSTRTVLMKIVLAGDGGVGKTSLRNRYLGKGFKNKYEMTIGADFAMHHSFIDCISVKFQIWDLAGQQNFKEVRSIYYMGCVGALLLFDVTQRKSFENVTHWVQEIWKHNGKHIIPLVLLGNKVDLRDQSPNSISSEEAQKNCNIFSELTKTHGFDVQYLDTSAKTGLHVADAFEILAQVRFNYLKSLKKI